MTGIAEDRITGNFFAWRIKLGTLCGGTPPPPPPPPPPLGTPQIYPELCGLSFDVIRRVIWENGIARHVSGREVRIHYDTLPRYQWDLVYDVLEDFPLGTIPSELKRLEGFFLEKRAAFS